MKPFVAALMIAAAAASSGCAPLDMSVFVEGASFLDETCTAEGDVNLIRGSLDIGPYVSLGLPPQYYGHFEIRSDLQPIETVSGTDVLAGNARNEFIATTVILSYEIFNGPSLQQDVREPIYFVVPPGADGDSFVQFNMLTPTAAQALAGAVPPGPNGQTLLITFQFEGNVRSASNALVPLRTQPVVFPVDVFNATTVPTCTAPAVPVINGPCGNTQELFTITCST